MRQLLAAILLASCSAQAFADDSGCEQIAHGTALAVGAAATFAAGPAGSAGAAILRSLGGWAAYELTDRTATQLVCDNSTRIEMAIYDVAMLSLCGDGNVNACTELGLLTTSLARDFAVCGSCTVQEVIGAFLMEDSEREAYFQSLRDVRGRSPSYLPVIARNHLQLDGQMLAAYYQGVSEGLQRSLLESFGSF